MCAPDSGYVLAYWYFTFTNQRSIDIDSLLSSITRQLCAGARKLDSSVHELWRNHHTAGSRPTRARLIETLDRVMVSLGTEGQHALIVLDALDEYPDEVMQASSGASRSSERNDVLGWLQDIHKHPNVHILVTSRDEADIRESFKEAVVLDIAQDLMGDLDLFIEGFIDDIVRRRPWKDKYRKQMSDRLKHSGERQVYLNCDLAGSS